MPIWSRMTIQVDPHTAVKMMNGMMIDASIRVVSGSPIHRALIAAASCPTASKS